MSVPKYASHESLSNTMGRNNDPSVMNEALGATLLGITLCSRHKHPDERAT
jgi:hypothetical protein